MRPDENDGSMESRLARLRGIVQGVGFREACVRQARALGITGWVRNRSDGSVEVMVQGSPEQLAEMCAWLRNGVPSAVVDSLEVNSLRSPVDRLDQFERLPTV
ncbi:acylphosphatase [Variovorax sp. J2P1-59]|uniref:acylphosphatase n=1 Tax=Variovorax flavidus TaxID=3053501 RepID=UPI002574C0B2|nr:acylphosphatase [Variovorax sp. J2P1-59]MDM0074439.1 acylphosphatase [Variovorax sp. J2P1-59]